MTVAAILSSVREVVQGLLPWAAEIRIAASGALGIGSAARRTELEGGGAGVARVGDLVLHIAFYPGIPGTVAPSLWVSTSQTAPYAWTQAAVATVAGPLSTDPGTVVKVVTGSARVTCG